MSYIQLPYGYVKNNKQIQFNLPRGYEEQQYLKEVPYLTNKNPTVENNLLNLLRNRDDLKNGYQQLVNMIMKYKKILMPQSALTENLIMQLLGAPQI